MAIPDYTGLGIQDAPLADSWQVDKPHQEPIETDMDGGNKRLRTRPGDEMSQISFSLMFTQAEYTTFATFVGTTLNRGTSRFTMRVWNGTTMVSKTVQLVRGTYTPKVQWPKVVVSMSLYVYGGL